MNRIRTFHCPLAGFAVALAVVLLSAPAYAQTSEQGQARPLIVVDGVVLRGGTAAEQDAVLKIIRPAIGSIEVLKGAAAVERFGDAARDGVIVIRLKSDFARGQPGAAAGAARDVVVTTAPFDALSPAPLVLIDGVEVPRTTLGVLAPQDIERIEVIKGAAAEEFGERGRGGVIRITTRKR